MPKVSVIIPIYKVEKYIERCARSLFEQTLDDIEYIFVDDCTPDKSVEILQDVLNDYTNRQSQVSILHMEKNCGQAAVRERGVKNAKGDYIINCDSDDWVDVNAYKEMYDFAVDNDADVVLCDYCITDGVIKQKKVGCHNVEKSILFKNLLIQKDDVMLSNKLFKTKIFEEILWPNGNMGEDMLICIQLVLKSNKIVYLPKSFYYYFKNPSSITAGTSKEAILYRFNQSILNANDLICIFKNNNLLDQYRGEVDRMLFNKKNLLRPLINEKKYYRQWRDTFSELNYKILFNHQVSLGMKVKHILAMMNLYHKSY